MPETTCAADIAYYEHRQTVQTTCAADIAYYEHRQTVQTQTTSWYFTSCANGHKQLLVLCKLMMEVFRVKHQRHCMLLLLTADDASVPCKTSKALYVAFVDS
eukprot:TRINITY_DN29817_c0_g1_i1.p1 TRINITY_DN29817_c0_g1~~TRINITY_DN29817_c0_g1_i1.p1  ORF type:complete len:102 (+),score=22.86 TRINITY_DN29817_c0_g1_i1:165-470(+)